MKMKKINLIVLAMLITIFIQGCASKNVNQVEEKKNTTNPNSVNVETSTSKYYSINTSTTSKISDTADQVAKQLLDSMRIKPNVEAIAITSFVDLNKLNKTTHFGRVLGESFFNELHSRGFLVSDFRGQKSLIVNADGEFFLSRDIRKLNNKVAIKYVLVGTYTRIGEGVLINARIMDNMTGVVIASSRVVHHNVNCALFENCPKHKPMNNIHLHKKKAKRVAMLTKRTIGLSTDGCSTVTCPKNCVGLDCNETRTQRIKHPIIIKKIMKKRCDYK